MENEKDNQEQTTIVTNEEIVEAPKEAEEHKVEGPNVLDNKCPNCGAPLFYNPEKSNWTCNYCSSSFSLEELQKYTNASSEKFQDKPSEIEYDLTDKEVDFVSCVCQNCGAEIVADEQTAATFCVYCGNTAIIKNKLVGKFAPDFVIPFQKEKNSAITAFKELSKGRPFMPKNFNDEKNIEKIRGVYIPFWLYDVNVSGAINYSAQRITTWSRGDTHYTKTDYYDVYRDATMDFEKIPADSSTRFANDIMDSIMPYDYSKLKTYNHAYLSGFLAEKYDDNEEKIAEDISSRALRSAETFVSSSLVGYSNKVVTSNGLKATHKKRYYALMPVWMVNVNYNNKPYIFAMNGESGKFIGNIPLDKKKAIIFFVILFIAIALAVILFSFISFKVGA